MSALTPEEFRLLSKSKRVDVLELEIAYSLKLLEFSKGFNFTTRTLSDEFDRGWQQITQERDSKIQLVIHAE
jgi:hypothetical protein